MTRAQRIERIMAEMLGRMPAHVDRSLPYDFDDFSLERAYRCAVSIVEYVDKHEAQEEARTT